MSKPQRASKLLAKRLVGRTSPGHKTSPSHGATSLGDLSTPWSVLCQGVLSSATTANGLAAHRVDHQVELVVGIPRMLTDGSRVVQPGRQDAVSSRPHQQRGQYMTVDLGWFLGMNVSHVKSYIFYVYKKLASNCIMFYPGGYIRDGFPLQAQVCFSPRLAKPDLPYGSFVLPQELSSPAPSTSKYFATPSLTVPRLLLTKSSFL